MPELSGLPGGSSGCVTWPFSWYRSATLSPGEAARAGKLAVWLPIVCVDLHMLSVESIALPSGRPLGGMRFNMKAS